MPHSSLEHERQARNKHWRRRPAIDEFTRASKLEEFNQRTDLSQSSSVGKKEEIE